MNPTTTGTFCRVGAYQQPRYGGVAIFRKNPLSLDGGGQGEGRKISIDCFGDSNKGGDMSLIIWTSAASKEPIKGKVFCLIA